MSEPVKRGEVYWGNLLPAKGSEPAKIRPVLVLSRDEFNTSPFNLLIVVPLTTQNKLYRSHVEISPFNSSLEKVSYAMCESIRSISRNRLGAYMGTVNEDVLDDISRIVYYLLDM